MSRSHKQLEDDIGRARNVARNNTQFLERARSIVSAHHREKFVSVPVGNMNNLGPSIINLQVWESTDKGFVHGTRVPYAKDHAALRLKKTGEPLLYTDTEELSDKLWNAWTDEVFGAMGFKK